MGASHPNPGHPQGPSTDVKPIRKLALSLNNGEITLKAAGAFVDSLPTEFSREAVVDEMFPGNTATILYIKSPSLLLRLLERGFNPREFRPRSTRDMMIAHIAFGWKDLVTKTLASQPKDVLDALEALAKKASESHVTLQEAALATLPRCAECGKLSFGPVAGTNTKVVLCEVCAECTVGSCRARRRHMSTKICKAHERAASLKQTIEAADQSAGPPPPYESPDSVLKPSAPPHESSDSIPKPSAPSF